MGQIHIFFRLKFVNNMVSALVENAVNALQFKLVLIITRSENSFGDLAHSWIVMDSKVINSSLMFTGCGFQESVKATLN